MKFQGAHTKWKMGGSDVPFALKISFPEIYNLNVRLALQIYHSPATCFLLFRYVHDSYDTFLMLKKLWFKDRNLSYMSLLCILLFAHGPLYIHRVYPSPHHTLIHEKNIASENP